MKDLYPPNTFGSLYNEGHLVSMTRVRFCRYIIVEGFEAWVNAGTIGKGVRKHIGTETMGKVIALRFHKDSNRETFKNHPKFMYNKWVNPRDT